MATVPCYLEERPRLLQLPTPQQSQLSVVATMTTTMEAKKMMRKKRMMKKTMELEKTTRTVAMALVMMTHTHASCRLCLAHKVHSQMQVNQRTAR